LWLHQNFSNLFKPSNSLRFEAPSSGCVVLNIWFQVKLTAAGALECSRKDPSAVVDSLGAVAAERRCLLVV